MRKLYEHWRPGPGTVLAVVKDAGTSSLSSTHAAALSIFERLPAQISILHTADQIPGRREIDAI